jgi:hypothetical protein
MRSTGGFGKIGARIRRSCGGSGLTRIIHPFPAEWAIRWGMCRVIGGRLAAGRASHQLKGMSTESTSPEPAFPPPLDSLLELGDQGVFLADWQDYGTMGFTAEHVPDLLRMATDDGLNTSDDETLVYAPMHAWRTLGRMRAAEAAVPLAELLVRYDDDAAREDLPRVLGMIGEPALEPVRLIVADASADTFLRGAAAAALLIAAQEHPDLRDRVVVLLAGQLEAWPQQDEIFNGFLVNNLTELGAVQAAPLMQAAFEADKVDETIRGDWEDVQVDLGLLEKRVTEPRTVRWISDLPRDLFPDRKPAPSNKKKPSAPKQAAKRKARKQARKQNRRK